MKINTKTVWQMTDEGMHIVEQDSYEHDGNVAQCFGGDSDTSSSTTTVTETNQSGISDNQGLAISGLGDIDVNLETTDLGAIDNAFEFANDVAGTAFRQSDRALETVQSSLATVATGGASNLASINSKTIIAAAAIIAAIFIFQRRK